MKRILLDKNYTLVHQKHSQEKFLFIQLNLKKNLEKVLLKEKLFSLQKSLEQEDLTKLDLN